ncbi:flagellar M-ring protein FliF [Wenzhouxiangella sp. AB-CW3]|uniref:flagellar basal-body MS-ring/collar protein FliF n=1 Tax=Wenzhouxiangella sp. AB-CW3 TaxID=2771012 RepID=UPI00168A6C8C|nr:flagellar basal-body MS-ring/collar protein FliF [Wenzhouxiangella sp. AB-CW3]QOC21204.1 flagellar M-ring protein FliF [Wenzhouxiangella sp. AB-CW3]
MAAQDVMTVNSRLAVIDQVPGLRQLLVLVGIAAAVAAGVSMVLWSWGDTESILHSNLSDRDAVEIVQTLDAAGIPNSYEAGSGVVRVPDNHLHDARLALASEGLPSAAGTGFEMLGEERGLTSSQFMENARYQRALEVEIQRTIASISAVRAARVHLAVPRESVFVRDRRPASASVLLNLHSGRRLEGAQVEAIMNLVASSVPDMERAQVSIIDQHGTLLSADSAGGGSRTGDEAYQRAQQVEERLARRVEDLLTPIVGLGRVRAQVTADIDFTVREETEELFDPEGQVIRSEQISEEPGGREWVRGIPGALSNQADADVAENDEADENNPEVPMSRRSTRNFEIGRTIRHSQTPIGSVRRLSVAVVVDQPREADEEGVMRPVPYSEDEIEHLTGLVREAVGFDVDRGDSVSVVNRPFREVEMDDAGTTDDFTLLERLDVLGILRIVASVFVVLLLILLVVRPLFRQLLFTAPATQQQALPAGAGGTAMLPDEDDRLREREQAPMDPKQRYEERINQARSAVNQDPKRVAQVVKQWVNEDG